VELSPDAKRAFKVQSYAAAPRIEGVEIVQLARHRDDGGALTELARLNDGRTQVPAGFTLRQINYSELEPGVIKAFHLHVRQTDVWYVPPGDRMLLVLVDVRKGSPTEGVRMRLVLGDGGSRLVRIPPGWPTACATWAPVQAASSTSSTSSSPPSRPRRMRGGCPGTILAPPSGT
jgi:dTDP-4-dehydrorhamnose 3,5-epimerase